MKSSVTYRMASIDVFRAFTMLLMIFVNDLWTLSGIPQWLEHTSAQTDGMGLADIVFPAFLVVMGMSLPFAIKNRLDKGQSKGQVLKHIVFRSSALLVMGVFTVNIPEINSQASGINAHLYEIFAVASFFLIWNVYPRIEGNRKFFYLGLRILGTLVLVILALIYRGQGSEPGEIVGFQPRWWGILGLIGWAYLGSAVIYLYLKDYFWLMLLWWLFFVGFNIAGHAGLFGEGEIFVGNGAFHAFTLVGTLLTLLFYKAQKEMAMRKFITQALIVSVTLVVLGFLLRHHFIISKILATPPWIFLCSGIAVFMFVAFYVLVDLKGKENWFTIIKAGGTSTLTCYLIPYFWYSIGAIYHLQLPSWLKTGGIGIVKSLLFAVGIIVITRYLEKFKIKLKI
jgi:heparan-alpha-glucosaminide N-acetyltransferase